MVLKSKKPQKIRILIVLVRMKGGVGRYALETKNKLEKQGYYVKILSREDDIKIFSFIKSFLKLRKVVKNKDYDILFTHDWSIAIPLLGFKNHFCTFHGTNHGIAGLLQKIVGKLFGKRLVVVGDNLKKIFPKATLVYEGVDLKQFKPNKKIKRIKGSVGFSNWTTGIYNYSLIKKAVKKSRGKFIVADGIKKEQMGEFYNKLDCFISLPPSWTGFGLVWLEAMASGVPIIIGNNAGIGAKLPITKVEDFGWKESLSEKEKVRIIAKALKNADKKDYRTWLEKNKEKFSWERHAEELMKLWRENV